MSNKSNECDRDKKSECNIKYKQVICTNYLLKVKTRHSSNT